jgi:hypothetical protein
VAQTALREESRDDRLQRLVTILRRCSDEKGGCLDEPRALKIIDKLSSVSDACDISLALLIHLADEPLTE